MRQQNPSGTPWDFRLWHFILRSRHVCNHSSFFFFPLILDHVLSCGWYLSRFSGSTFIVSFTHSFFLQTTIELKKLFEFEWKKKITDPNQNNQWLQFFVASAISHLLSHGSKQEATAAAILIRCTAIVWSGWIFPPHLIVGSRCNKGWQTTDRRTQVTK